MTTRNATGSISRRTALAGLGVAGVGAALAARPALAQDAAVSPLAGHPLVGLWVGMLPITPGEPPVPIPSLYGADGSVVLAWPVSEAGAAGVGYASSVVGVWEAVGDRGAHFTAVQVLTDAAGAFTGTITIDGHPSVQEDGETFVDDSTATKLTVRDPSGAVVSVAGGDGSFPTVMGYRMRPGNPGIPVVTAEASPAAEPLVAVVLDAALLTVPGGSAVSGHLVDAPGWGQTISFPTASAAIVHVAAGAYTVRSDGPVVVVRPSADGAAVAEAVPPGQEATAHAGESMLYLSSSRIEESNRGDAPTDRYTFVVVGDGEPTIENVQGTTSGEFLAAIEPDQWSTLPSGPVTVTFAIADATAEVVPPDGELQMVGELGVPTPRRLVISVSPGALPGATPVELAMS
jgi:hypothetical protein